MMLEAMSGGVDCSECDFGMSKFQRHANQTARVKISELYFNILILNYLL